MLARAYVLISTTLPTKDRDRVDHLSKFFSTFEAAFSQSCDKSLPNLVPRTGIASVFQIIGTGPCVRPA